VQRVWASASPPAEQHAMDLLAEVRPGEENAPAAGASPGCELSIGLIRFYRRVHIFPGLTVNLLKSGPSLSVEVRGAHVTIGKRCVSRTVGIPGFGIFYTSLTGYHTGVHSLHREPPALIGQVAPPRRFPRWLLGAIVVGLVGGCAAALVISMLLPAP